MGWLNSIRNLEFPIKLPIVDYFYDRTRTHRVDKRNVDFATLLGIHYVLTFLSIFLILAACKPLPTLGLWYTILTFSIGTMQMASFIWNFKEVKPKGLVNLIICCWVPRLLASIYYQCKLIFHSSEIKLSEYLLSILFLFTVMALLPIVVIYRAHNMKMIQREDQKLQEREAASLVMENEMREEQGQEETRF